MKKNISINISGIIFHIEEDGYESLKRYLDSINRYFSSFEDSSEILADIEGRIAEIFLSKLNEEKQVITAEDVNALMATMGSVSDFRAAEESTEKETSSDTSEGTGTYVPPKQLFRDQNRKMLGGVAAGLGNYFNVDPLWFRLLFVALTFAGGFTILVYIIMWIVVPGSYTLEAPQLGKKMFRDPQTKVIGGVSGGIAAYFGIDVILVRLLFVGLIFAGGLGIIFYVILWICLPEARTITDRMQMQGEPVTLSNIESTIKKNFNIREGDEESALAKILLFPFRLLGLILNALGKILNPLAHVIRIVVGVILIFAGIALVLGVVATAAVLLGLFAGEVFSSTWFVDFSDLGLPVDALARAFPGWVVLAAVVAVLIPCIFLILAGASTIARKMVFKGTVGWSMLALFFVSLAMLAVGIPKIAFAFREQGEYRVESTYQVAGHTAVLKLNESDPDYDAVQLTLRGHDGPGFRLVQIFEAQGSSRTKAIENAQMVDYQVEVTDSVFIFNDRLEFKENAVFRGQQLNMILYIPYEFPFTMDYGMSRFISQYVDSDYFDGYTWKITKQGLECINCDGGSQANVNDLRDFDAIKISGRFDVRIAHGSNYGVEMTGSETVRNAYDVRVSGGTLVVDHVGGAVDWDDRDWRRIRAGKLRMTITLPDLEKIEAQGMGSVELDDIRGDRVEIETSGPVNIKGHVNVDELSLRLTGSSTADLSGSAGSMNARVQFASRLRAYEFEARNAFVEVDGASIAKVHVTETLEMDEGVASDIDYRGHPKVQRRL